MRTSLLLAFAWLTTTAFADDVAKPATIEHDKAKGLIRALSLTTLKPTTVKTARTWSFKQLECTTKAAEELYELPATVCTADGKKISGAAAVLLEKAMDEAEIKTPYMMGVKQIRASALTCTNEERFKEKGPFYCTYTPVVRGE